MKKPLSTILCSLLLLGSFAIRATAQTTDLAGTVTDETGAILGGATVTLDDGKGNKRTTTTDELGHYKLAGVPAGNYTLTVTADGFGTASQQIETGSKKPGPLNFSLKVVINEQMEVKPDSATISTEPDKNLSAITLTPKDLESLPDDPDELLDTLRQMAGSSGVPGSASLYVDGFREGGRLPPKEAILMVRINSNPFAAEFSEIGFGRIEIVTKPGSDKFHGGFRVNFNDESLNGRNAAAAFRAPLQVRNYSGNFNGPIIRNRWGFFFDMDRREQDDNAVVNATIINPTTFQPVPFGTTILSPTRATNFTLRTDFLATKRHSLGFSYRYTNTVQSDAGLGGGFDLPERAFNRTSHDDTLRFSLTTIASETSVNEIRMELSRRDSGARSLSNAPAISVFDAFTSGGNQGSLFSDNTNSNLEFTDNFTFTHKKHVLKFGYRADAVRVENLNRANFGGTFTFGSDFERDANGNIIHDASGEAVPITALERYRRTLLQLPGYHPSQFSITTGDPFAGLSQWEMAWFAQDDWKLSRRVTLSYGLRHEFQTHLQDKLNFAPRVGIAWQADAKGRSTIRAGGGVFYSRLDNGITLDAVRLDGAHQRQLLIPSPAFFPNVPVSVSSQDGVFERFSTLRIKAADLNAPYSIIGTVGYDRQLPKNMFMSVGYTWQRGVHLLRSRDLNAPAPGSGGIRPDPSQGQILEFESTGRSIRNEFRVTFRSNFSRTLSVFSNYILASTNSDTDSAYSLPANPFDLSAEYGRAGFDVRHRFFVGGQYALPWDVRVAPYIAVTSGPPFNIVTGRDNNLDASFIDRPSLVPAGTPGAIVTRIGIFNPDPVPGEQIIPRNFGNGPGQLNVNMNFSKTIGFGPAPAPFGAQAANNGQGGDQNQRNTGRGNRGGGGSAGGGGRRGGGGGGFGGGALAGGPGGGAFGNDTRHRYNLTMSVNIQNILNHTNFPGYSGTLGSEFFALSNRALQARKVELALRFAF
ncbi:MAG: hypothetical protein DMF61_20390 [Blastocatellia bacterium AA13]|nr:MAG: hypothetical protein DMF61_20390 [Blastocatellia bacterium AA13]